MTIISRRGSATAQHMTARKNAARWNVRCVVTARSRKRRWHRDWPTRVRRDPRGRNEFKPGLPRVEAAVGRLRKEIESNCDNVGDQFAEEARAIHYGEAEERGIYGEATPEQAIELAEEEIEIYRIPGKIRKDA